MGLANICILACMVLVTVSGTLCLYLGSESSLDGKYPDDIGVSGRKMRLPDRNSNPLHR